MFQGGTNASNLEQYALMELYALSPVLVTMGGRAVWDYVDAPSMESSNFFGGGAQLEVRIPLGGRLKSTKFVTLSDVLALNLIASYISRPPSVDELTAVRATPEGLRYGNPELGNEQMASAQGGFKWNAGIFDGLLYYSFSRFDSMILTRQAYGEMGPSDYDFTPCEAGYGCRVYDNAGGANLHALELLGRFNIKTYLTMGLLLNYTHGTQERFSGGWEPMSIIPPLNGAVWIRAMYERYGLWGELRLKWALGQDRLSSRDQLDPAVCGLEGGACGGTGWYTLLALRGGVRIGNRFFVSFAFHNLANMYYKTHGSILRGTGVGASVSIEAKL